jgi:hypothetical protein
MKNILNVLELEMIMKVLLIPKWRQVLRILLIEILSIKIFWSHVKSKSNSHRIPKVVSYKDFINLSGLTHKESVIYLTSSL